MKRFLHSPEGASKGAALIIVLAFVVLVTALAVAYFSRAATDRQLAQSSYKDTSADLLARSALDIVVGNLKQEIANSGTTVTQANIQPQRSGDDVSIPNLIRRSVRNDGIPPPGVASLASNVSSTSTSGNGRSISNARWNSHYLVPLLNPAGTDSTPVLSFVAPDWVMVTAQGPNTAPAPNAVIGRYAFAVYDEGGLIDMNLGGFPTYAGLSLPTRPTRRLRPSYPSEESEIMLATCQPPDINPDHDNENGNTGVPFSCGPYHANHNPTSFSADRLPHGLLINPLDGTIFGIPTSPGSFTITVTASNQCGPGHPLTLNLTIDGLPSPDSTPWPVNRARKGTIAFADLTALPSSPAITAAQINKLMGWRNYATTQQPTSASFDNPSFLLASADNYAKYFLGAALPFTADFKTVSTALQNNRTDQGVMTRQELIKLQRTIGFMPTLLQYLGTFSREQNWPAPGWPQTVAARWDMNYLALAIPDAWIVHPGHHGQGHAWGLQRHTEFAQRFGLVWVNGTHNLATRLLDPNYYGRWKYIHTLNPLPASNPDFFQLIDYAMNQANGGVPDPNHVRNTFTVGAALIDQYDTDDLYDPDPNPPANNDAGNTITIIDTLGNGNPADYVYGIEGMSFDNPIFNLLRPPFAPYPPGPPASYPLLNRRFENVGEFGYAYNPASTTPGKTLDFASSTSHDKPMLDFFTYNTASVRAGIVNLNTRNGPVLASIIRGAFLMDPGAENPPDPNHPLVSQQDALTAGQAIVQETTNTTAGRGPSLTRADVARLAAAAATALPGVLGVSDETKQTIARALAETGQARTWNLMIDVIVQTGRYAPDATDITQANKFVVEGEKRYWLHIALGRDLVNLNGTPCSTGSGCQVGVLGTQLEEVIE